MKIQVIGSGCNTCKKLHEMVQTIVKEKGSNDIVEYLSGDACTDKILELGAMGSPVLLVDDTVVMVGFVPDKGRIKAKIYGHI